MIGLALSVFAERKRGVDRGDGVVGQKKARERRGRRKRSSAKYIDPSLKLERGMGGLIHVAVW